MKDCFCGGMFYGVERKQSKQRVTLCTTTYCSAPQCGEQSLCWYLGTRPCRCSRERFWEDLDNEDKKRMHHPSPIQIPMIQLVGDSPDFCVLPGQGTQRFQHLWLAEGLRSVLALSSVSCFLATGTGFGVSYSSKHLTGRRRVLLRGTEGQHCILLCWSAPPPHPGVAHICCQRGMHMFPPHSRSLLVWQWVLGKHWRQWDMNLPMPYFQTFSSRSWACPAWCPCCPCMLDHPQIFPVPCVRHR